MGSVPVDGPERFPPMQGALNFRDLGGLPTDDGRTTRVGRLFRSDSLHELTADDVEYLRRAGLRSVIDLRRATEVERNGRGPLAFEPIRYVNLPVVLVDDVRASAPPAALEDLALLYVWSLEVGGRALAEALTVVADPGNLPLVFHCSAGKDRTGVLAALILDIAGVSRPSIVADYALTDARMPLVVARLEREADAQERMAEIPLFQYRAEPRSVERFLELLDQRFGGARQWASDAGVPAGAIDRIRAALVD